MRKLIRKRGEYIAAEWSLIAHQQFVVYLKINISRERNINTLFYYWWIHAAGKGFISLFSSPALDNTLSY